jgi:hypothetical protein
MDKRTLEYVVELIDGEVSRIKKTKPTSNTPRQITNDGKLSALFKLKSRLEAKIDKYNYENPVSSNVRKI